jgi:hypothetical protein
MTGLASPGEQRRAAKAVLLGAALGVLLAMLGDGRRRS